RARAAARVAGAARALGVLRALLVHAEALVHVAIAVVILAVADLHLHRTAEDVRIGGFDVALAGGESRLPRAAHRRHVVEHHHVLRDGRQANDIGEDGIPLHRAVIVELLHRRERVGAAAPHARLLRLATFGGDDQHVGAARDLRVTTL